MGNIDPISHNLSEIERRQTAQHLYEMKKLEIDFEQMKKLEIAFERLKNKVNKWGREKRQNQQLKGD